MFPLCIYFCFTFNTLEHLFEIGNRISNLIFIRVYYSTITIMELFKANFVDTEGIAIKSRCHEFRKVLTNPCDREFCYKLATIEFLNLYSETKG